MKYNDFKGSVETSNLGTVIMATKNSNIVTGESKTFWNVYNILNSKGWLKFSVQVSKPVQYGSVLVLRTLYYHVHRSHLKTQTYIYIYTITLYM